VTAVDDGRLRVWELESGRANCELSKATPLGSTR
jgi:hypothetical protein